MPDAFPSDLPPVTPEVSAAIKAGSQLPLLDLGPFLAGEPGALDQLAADVRAIQESLGFYAIINHGVDQALIDAVVEQGRQLFALPEAVKGKWRAQHHMQGYWPANSTANARPGFEHENKARQERIDTIAGWAFLRERDEDDPKVKAGLRHRAPNKWPDAALLPDFKATLQAYHAAMLRLALRLLPVYARSLSLPETYFDGQFTEAEWYSRINYYDHTLNAEGAVGAGAHTDHSFLTLLPMSGVPGLQVRNPDNSWFDVAHVPGAIIVNTGEWLNQLTNGRFIGTPHRVTVPTVDRFSMPFFMDPNDDAYNDPIPGALAPGEAPRFERKPWHDFFVQYVSAYSK
jgi:isopenicillin N synthase-like dioxygenase